MMLSVRGALSAIVIVLMFGLPGRSYAQTVTESVASLSPMDAELISRGLAAQRRSQSATRPARSGRELAKRAAVFGAITGLAAGMTIAGYCRSEGNSCPRAAFGYFVTFGAIGALVGVTTAR
jgi:hypothetical protein